LAQKQQAPTKPEKPKETTPESIASIASVLVSGLFIITFIVQAFEIPSGSMENTLLVGDHVFVDRLTPTRKAGYMPLMPYREIKRGDIVVFLHPREPGMYVVKRIMGLPGDKVHLSRGRLYVNGQSVNEPYLNPQYFYDAYRDEFPSVPPIGQRDIEMKYPEWPLLMSAAINGRDIVVPNDSYFGMGDNRARSLDSRYWGFIPRDNVVGRPLFIYWAFKTPEDQYQHTSLGDRAAFLMHIVTHFFGDTYWSRMFHIVR
jgi:signal peptidase I